MKTFVALSAAALLGAYAAPALATVTLHVSTVYAAGATFIGDVEFEDATYTKAVDVTGTLTGFGASNADIKWVYANGLNYAPAGSYGTFLMSGVEPAYGMYFISLTINNSNAPTLDFSSAGYGNSITYDDVMVSGTLGMVPEPAAWTLMIAGFGLVGGSMRRRAATINAVAA